MEKISKCLIDLINESEVISFDLFDTLVFRNIAEPKDIFEIISKKYKIHFFPLIRIFAEKIARKRNNGKEIELSHIYSIISKIYGKRKSEMLMSEEIVLEETMCIFNTDFNSVLELCKNKRIVIVSDMYLPLSSIKKIVEKVPFNINPRIYLSSELKKSKKNGDIFDYVIDIEGVDSSKILHIGDNKNSDYFIPISKGINAFHYQRDCISLIHKYKTNDINLNNLSAFIVNTEPVNYSIYSRIGYEILGPLLVGFCTYLHYYLSKKNISDIYFLSRDGLIIKNAFDIIYNDFNTKYLYASRKALITPTIHKCKNVDELMDSMYIPYKTSFLYLGHKFDLTDDIIEKICKKYAIISSKIYKTSFIKSNKKMRLILNDFLAIIKQRKLGYEELVGYFEQEINSENLCICDIGWNCNMQKAIQRMEKYKIVNGFYVGLNPFTISESQNRFGYLTNNSKKTYKKIKSFIPLFEFLFTASHGSVTGYMNEGNSYTGVFDIPEYSKGANDYNILLQIQTGALKFVSNYKENLSSLYFQNDLFSCSYGIYALGTNPTLEEVDALANVEFKDGKIKKMISCSNGKGISRFIRDYKESLWRVGFLKKFFKFKFLYYRFDQLIRKIVMLGKKDY